MLPISGINFKTGFNGKINKNQNINHFQLQSDSVSFKGDEKIALLTEKKVTRLLSDLFAVKFDKVGNKYISKKPISLYNIEDNKEFFNMLLDAQQGLVRGIKEKNQLGLFAKKVFNLLGLKSLVFTGAEGGAVADKSGSIVSKFSLTQMTRNKINSAFISNDLKEVLNKEFAKNNDVIKVRHGKDKFLLKNEHMFSDDLASPIRNVIVEKI